MAWLQQHASRIFRLASIVSLIAAVTWFLWPHETWNRVPEALIAVVTALGVWLWQEIPNFPIEHPHQRDVR